MLVTRIINTLEIMVKPAIKVKRNSILSLKNIKEYPNSLSESTIQINQQSTKE
jgi:hypothetical protein